MLIAELELLLRLMSLLIKSLLVSLVDVVHVAQAISIESIGCACELLIRVQHAVGSLLVSVHHVQLGGVTVNDSL